MLDFVSTLVLDEPLVELDRPPVALLVEVREDEGRERLAANAALVGLREPFLDQRLHVEALVRRAGEDDPRMAAQAPVELGHLRGLVGARGGDPDGAVAPPPARDWDGAR